MRRRERTLAGWLPGMVLLLSARITFAQPASRPAPVPPASLRAVRTWLPLDTLLAPTERIGCDAGAQPISVAGTGTVTGNAVSAANSTAARTAWREAQDALLEGNRAVARTKLEETVRADPRDARAWLELAAVLEQLGEPAPARTAACRVLSMNTATTGQRDDAQRRWERLLTPEMSNNRGLAARRHADGVRLAYRGEWDAARRAFDDVVRVMPSAPSAWRNRAIVGAEAGDLAIARRDLERYVQLGPPIDERLMLTRALSALQRPRYDVTTAAVSGVLPGGAQFSTGRPAAGVLVLAGVVGSGALAFTSRTRERTVPFLDPNGEPAPYVERYRVQPYRTAGLAVGAGVLVGALIEGVVYASRSSRLPRLSVETGPRGVGVGSQLFLGGRGRSTGDPKTGR